MSFSLGLGATEVSDKLRMQGVDVLDSPSSSSSTTLTINFSSGNPRIEETRGVMHLFPEDPSISCLPIGRKSLVSVLGVPNHMTYADFCRFSGSFIDHVLEMRVVRTDGVEDRYSILMRFDYQDSADKFHQHFNGKQYSSFEEEYCRVLFTIDVQFTGTLELSQPSPTSTAEPPSCAVCLEKLEQDMGGILTTICNHSFHCSCISKWTDSSCPVCRYFQEQPEKSVCFVCETSENLWICVICGVVGCGRYKKGHAIDHWKETQHCYSLELETHRVWDYVGNNYVHRLIQTKADGILVELNARCGHAKDGCSGCDCGDSVYSETLLNSKVEAMVNEYNQLLATQLENQKIYFEDLLREVKEENAIAVSKAIRDALSVSVKVQKLQAKLERCEKEKTFLCEVNENLVKNQEIWQAKIQAIEEGEKNALRDKDDRIAILQEQLQHLMAQLETGNPLIQMN